MAGIWDRIIPGSDRVSAHLLKAAMYLSVRGVFTDAQIVAAINGDITAPLNAQALSDLGAIKAAISAGATTADRLERLERFDALNICIEMGVLTSEAEYRSQLGI